MTGCFTVIVQPGRNPELRGAMRACGTSSALCHACCPSRHHFPPAVVCLQSIVDAATFLGSIPPPSKHRLEGSHGPRTKGGHGQGTSEEEDGEEEEDVPVMSLVAARPPRRGPVVVADLSRALELGTAALAGEAGQGAGAPPAAQASALAKACVLELQTGPMSMWVWTCVVPGCCVLAGWP